MKKVLRTLVHFLVFACAFSVLIAPQVHNQQSVNDVYKVRLDTGWSIKLNNEELEMTGSLDDFHMPVTNKGDFVELKTILPDNLEDRVAISTYPVHSVLKVYVDDELIFENGEDRYERGLMIGYGHQFIPLPDDASGKEIKITLFVTEDNAFSNIVAPEIYKETSLMIDYIQERYIPLVAALGLIAAGACITCVAFISCFKFKEMERLLGIGAFALLIGSWSLCNYDLALIYTREIAAKSLLEYLSLYMVMVPLFVYFMDDVRNHKQKWLKLIYECLFAFQLIFLAVVVLLQGHNIVHFPVFVNTYQIFLVVSGFLMAYLLVWNLIVNKRHQILFVGFVVMIFVAVRDIVMFNVVKYLTKLGFSGYYRSYISLGAVIFVVALLTDFISEMRGRVYALAESEVYIKMAYNDPLTGLYTRRKCTEVMEEITQEKGVYAVMVFDLNGLKDVNDSMGHVYGDEMITRFANILRKTYTNNEIICRFGGDEFTVLFTKPPKRSYEETKEYMTKLIDDDNKEHSEIKISVSAGFAISTEFEDPCPEDVFKAADRRMYEDKDKYYKETGLNRRKHNTTS